METQKHGREDRPNDQHPDEVHFTEPGKAIKAQDKIDIVQSEFGREQGQRPADEHIDDRFSQIDEADAKPKDQLQNDLDTEDLTRDSAGYMNDQTSADRDTGNSRDDGWEESRTSRHK